ncbi:uncharacterized protein LOC110811163 [Carica papaya]|uniref:uncharacterized protein LOC110811163 n=1 Tax=Carica papaya TaxID=3649 RepID=UPI000B8CFC6B|nr:uncharacterized protein LOC110811163 [Carica papaya]
MSTVIKATRVSLSFPPIASLQAKADGHDQTIWAFSASQCHGVWHDAVLVVAAVLFVVYLGLNAKKDSKKLWNGGSYVMISYYALLCLASSLNLAWCCLQAWQCSPENEFAWNLLSLFTTSGMLCLEISLVAFLLQESYAAGLEILARTFIISSIIVGTDILLKAVYVFGYGVPLFIEGTGTTDRLKWGLLIVHKLLLTVTYGFILFVHLSKWKEKLPPKPSFYHYIIVMFASSTLGLLACGLAALGAGFGIWLYSLTIICYHSLYLPFLYATFLSDFFQREDFLLDNAYYWEMRDAGFFDAILD